MPSIFDNIYYYIVANLICFVNDFFNFCSIDAFYHDWNEILEQTFIKLFIKIYLPIKSFFLNFYSSFDFETIKIKLYVKYFLSFDFEVIKIKLYVKYFL